MTEMPPGWVTTTVGDVFEVVGGGTPDTAIDAYWTGTTPWISSADISEAGAISIRRKVTSEAIARSATSRVPAGSVIVVTRVGLGKVARASEPIAFSQDCQALLPVPGINPEFLRIQLSSTAQAFKYQGRGTTISGVTKRQLLDLPLFIPPTVEQDRIVAGIEEQFSRLDAGVLTLGHVRDNLKKMRASVINAGLTGRLAPQSPRDESARLLFQRMSKERAESPRGMLGASVRAQSHNNSGDWRIPKSWMTIPLPLAAYFQEGPGLRNWQFRESGIPFLNIRTLQDGRIVRRLCQFLDPLEVERKYSHFLAEDGDIVCSTSGTIGKVAVVTKEDLPIMLNTSVVRFRPYGPSGPDPGFIMLFLQSPYFMDQARKAVTGSAQINLGPSHLKKMMFPLPPLAEQRRIVRTSQQLLSIVASLDHAVDAALLHDKSLRSSILSAAFSGKLVPQDDNDERASTLLERIVAQRGVSNGNETNRFRYRRAPRSRVLA